MSGRRSISHAGRLLSLIVGLILVSGVPAIARAPGMGGATAGHPRREATPHPAERPATGRASLPSRHPGSAPATGSAGVSNNGTASGASLDDIFDVWTADNTQLNTSVTGKIVEPHGGTAFDDRHNSYTDSNYWNFCTAGAATVAAYYWITDAVINRPGQNYTEQYGPHKSTTYWRSSDTGTSADTGNLYATKGRGYLMYLAEYTKPPAFSRPGILDFSTYQTSGGNIGDAALALNWEIFGNQNFFWQLYRVPGTSKSSFIASVENDLFDQGTPTLVALNTYISSTTRLPNWTHSLGHAIAIVGYNNTTSEFTYIDTCGRACNGSAGNHNGGTYTISFSKMYTLMADYGYGFAS
ncbi:MAG: hypothetical protein QOH61_1082 [Chloroflexota bacterium]|nr:hypothetical protein [Chloroflexota bacterium]